MDQRKLVILGGLILLLIALGLNWFTDYRQTPTSHTVPTSLLPDAIVTNLQQQTYADDGQPSYSMSAGRASQFTEKNITQLTDLHVILFSSGTPSWHLDAHSGLSVDNGDIIELMGDVSIKQDAERYTLPITLLTHSLRLSPKKEYAETHEPVTILQGTGLTQATGMQVNIKEGEIVLLSEVKSRYETTP